jgi:ABC-type uncharacterized transport system substrate-binding protein
MRKIEQFTKKQVDLIRQTLLDVERNIGKMGSPSDPKNATLAETLRKAVEKAGEDFVGSDEIMNARKTTGL